ncbi:MAG TPA: thiamine pyrophosphate-binding protein [Rhizomicrobium sp.]|jgi:acetolactate synthase-1/2/3 large subunit
MSLPASPPSQSEQTAAQALVAQLIAQKVRHVFCVPGESYLAVLDALYDSGIQVTSCRNEGGAAMMAEAYGKATGRPGICFVTRGPGATNASAGIHIAHQDSTPLILFVGQVERKAKDRDSFQELDYRAVFGSMTKWTAEIGDPTRMAEYVGRAFSTAMAGRPGPVVLALPRDVLTGKAQAHDPQFIEALETAPAPAQIAHLADLIAEARRPLLLLGGGRWTPQACAAATRFAERFQMPVATSYRRSPLFHPAHPNYAGDLGLAPNPKLLARAKASDLVIVAGARLNETTSQGYTLFDIPQPQTKLVHVYPGAEELGRIWQAHLAIHASPQRFAEALDGLTPRSTPVWADEARTAHEDYLAWSETPVPQPGAVNLSAIMIWLRENLPDDTILCNGAGNYASWIHRFYRFRHFATQIAPISASMGYGVPAAVAMQQLHPQRKVISINGDGDFLMNGQEFATAVQYKLPIIVLVFDNSLYGTIRMHQEREYPGRVIATELVNPDFAAYARSFGGFGAVVEKTEDFAPAFRAAETSGLPSILHVKYDGEGITPVSTLSGIRAQATARQA